MAAETVEDAVGWRNRTLRMSDDVWDRLALVARRNHRSRSDEMRRAIELHLAREEDAKLAKSRR